MKLLSADQNTKILFLQYATDEIMTYFYNMDQNKKLNSSKVHIFWYFKDLVIFTVSIVGVLPD